MVPSRGDRHRCRSGLVSVAFLSVLIYVRNLAIGSIGGNLDQEAVFLARPSIRAIENDADPSGGNVTAAALAAQTSAPTRLFPPNMFWTMRHYMHLTAKERTFRRGCQSVNPGYNARLYDDASSRNFVLRYFPEWIELYDMLDKPVMKADMWRYLVLYQFGGVYFDLDVQCYEKPIDEWDELVRSGTIPIWPQTKVSSLNAATASARRDVRMIVGMEFRDWGDGRSRFQIVQWTMASQPQHSILLRTVQLINKTMELVRRGKHPSNDVVSITGPVVFTRAVAEHMVRHGRLKQDQVRTHNASDEYWIEVDDEELDPNTAILVGDVLILHKNAFGYHALHRDKIYSGERYVRHHFAGRWRLKRY